MGLDMYLMKRSELIRDENGEYVKPDDIEVGYFRKFNALHNYITTVLTDHAGTNCEEINLSTEQLTDILETLEKAAAILEKGVYDAEANSYDEDTCEQIEEFFAPTSGFFFGSTEIDDWFRDDVNDAIPVIRSVLDMSKNGDKIYYYSWW